MRLLITGGAGYIGSIVAELAVEAGHEVVVLDDLRAGHLAAIPPACGVVEGRVGDPAALTRAFALGPFDAVIHLAAEAAIEASVHDPGLFFQANLVESLTLLDAMREHGTRRFVLSSTAATYGSPVFVPMTEEHPQQPINAYGESKLMLERCLRWYHQAYGLKVVGFRYFNAAGATAARGEDRPHETHLLPLALDAASGRRPPLRVFGEDYPTEDGTCVRDYVHVIDIARAHLLALDHVDEIGLDFFNIGSGVGFSVKQVAETIERTLGLSVPRQPAARRPGDPAVLVASADRARARLGWTPRHSGLEPIIESAWRWRCQHPRGYAS
jgi:UDP-glucose 4-epimerase